MRTTCANMAITLSEPYIQSLNADWYKPYVQQIDMLRLDVLHPVVSGNKWYKLKRNIQFAIEQGYISILTFGGGYSNHLIAAAATAHYYGLNSIGIVCGQHATLTSTLEACEEYKMQLEFVPHDEYKQKTDEEWLNEILKKYDHPFMIPEGGANQQGREGTEEIAQYISGDYTHICLSVGTGTTFIGLRNVLKPAQQMLGYAPMKGGNYLQSEIIPFLKPVQNTNWQLFDAYHFGGFGKQNDQLISFMNSFYRTNQIPLDIVYTGKMMYGIQQQLNQNFFPADAKILCIHTGGLQGNASVKDKLLF